MKAKRITLEACNGNGSCCVVMPYPPFPKLGEIITETTPITKAQIDWRVTAIEDAYAYIFSRPPAEQCAADAVAASHAAAHQPAADAVAASHAAAHQPAADEIRCSDCNRRAGSQHHPGCHRQGIVTNASDYRDKTN